MRRLRVGILGATGMVGQRFICLLENHPWFEVVVIAASPKSSGKKYKESVHGRWSMKIPVPKNVGDLILFAAERDKKEVAYHVDLVFCALDLEKEDIIRIENAYAKLGVPVISNNSANRWKEDIPMIIPEVNANHLKIIKAQQKNHGFTKGFIVVKPNCSIQSYVLILRALQQFMPTKVHVTSLQAISGAGKTFITWPEMVDNVIPFINGEEEKSEQEPLKILGKVTSNKIAQASVPKISATCIRVPTSDGHMASVSVSFEKKPTYGEIIQSVSMFDPLISLHLPSSPKQLIHYFEQESRPQTGLDRERDNCMGISMGRLRKGKLFDWDFVALSHNTIRGAAGGAILTAELLVKKGII